MFSPHCDLEQDCERKLWMKGEANHRFCRSCIWVTESLLASLRTLPEGRFKTLNIVPKGSLELPKTNHLEDKLNPLNNKDCVYNSVDVILFAQVILFIVLLFPNPNTAVLTACRTGLGFPTALCHGNSFFLFYFNLQRNYASFLVLARWVDLNRAILRSLKDCCRGKQTRISSRQNEINCTVSALPPRS